MRAAARHPGDSQAGAVGVIHSRTPLVRSEYASRTSHVGTAADRRASAFVELTCSLFLALPGSARSPPAHLAQAGAWGVEHKGK